MTDTTTTTETTNEPTVTVIQVPDDHAAKVMEYVKTLQQEADVTGYAFSRPTAATGGPISGTGCSVTGGTLSPSDFNCKDSDT